MNETWLDHLSSLKSLTYLDLSLPTTSFPSPCPSLTAALSSVGPHLTHLSLASHSDLSASDLTQSIAPHCHCLRSLDLSLLTELEDDPTAEFFDLWGQTREASVEEDKAPLTEVNLQGNHGLKGRTLGVLARMAGGDVEVLNLSGWKDVEKEWLDAVFGPEKIEPVRLGESGSGDKESVEEPVEDQGKEKTEVDDGEAKKVEELANAKVFRALRKLDLGWCSEFLCFFCAWCIFVLIGCWWDHEGNVTDFTLKDVLDNSPNLNKLIVWGKCDLFFFPL